LSHEPTALQEIVQGLDTHSLNQVAFNLPSRLISKVYLFRTIFRGTGWSFANDPDFMHVSSDPKFWDGVNEKFYKKYEGLDKQHKIWMDLTLAGQPLVGPLGREWLIPIVHKPGKELKLPWTLVSNYPVQGTGADIMTIARISFYNRVKKLGIPCKFISTVHDSIVVDAPTQYLQQLADIAYAVFDDLIMNIEKLFGYEWKTPLACECKFGPNMKDHTKILRSA
jgi:hypothetical protein